MSSVSRGSLSHPTVTKLFDALTAGEVEPIMSMSVPDVVCSLGNIGPFTGQDGFRAALNRLFGISHGVRHEVVTEWTFGNEIIVQATAHYDRISDGKHIALAGVTVITVTDEGLLAGWNAYVDPTPLYH